MQDEFCNFKTSCIGATLTNFRDIEHGSEMSLQSAAQSVGPISVAIDAGHKSFQVSSYTVLHYIIHMISTWLRCTKKVFITNLNAAPPSWTMVYWLWVMELRISKITGL